MEEVGAPLRAGAAAEAQSKLTAKAAKNAKRPCRVAQRSHVASFLASLARLAVE
jgi:hypothetical protein